MFDGIFDGMLVECSKECSMDEFGVDDSADGCRRQEHSTTIRIRAKQQVRA